MYDADYEQYKREQDNYEAYLRAREEVDDPDFDDDGTPANYVTRDSGKKAVHADGVVRDTEAGKPRFDLFLPEGVPFDEQLLTRVAWLYERGAAKYGDRNWEKSETEETLAHHRAAFLRHVFRFYFGVEDGEDHAAAVVWNVNAIDLTRRNIKAKAEALGKMTEYLEETQEALKEETGPAGQPWTPWQIPDIMSAGPNITPCEIKTDNKFPEDEGPDGKWATAIKRLDIAAHIQAVLSGVVRLDSLWEEGDRLCQIGFCNGWVYSLVQDTWYAETIAGAAAPRSFRRLCEQFIPLKVMSGKYAGLVIDKGTVRYEPE